MTDATKTAGVGWPLRDAVRASLARRRIRAVARGAGDGLALDPMDVGIDVPGLLLEETRELGPGSPVLVRIVRALEHSGGAAAVVDGLFAPEPFRRERSARLAGAIRSERLVPWLAPLLSARELSVRQAAARALGRIGGARAADALLASIQRRGPSPRLVIELARAAPDLYLESCLKSHRRLVTRHAVAIAAGLRRRHTAVTPLLGLLRAGSKRERVAACRALGWIAEGSSTRALAAALDDREWRVRASAAKALLELAEPSVAESLQGCLADRQPAVRRAASRALRRMLARTSGENGGCL